MTNKLDSMLNEVQFRTGKKLEEIAEELGYSRPYLSKMRKTGSEPVEGRIREVYKDIFAPVTNSVTALEAFLSVVASRVSATFLPLFCGILIVNFTALFTAH